MIVGNRVFLGVGVIVLPGATIGDDAIVGAGSVVTKSIPPKEVWGVSSGTKNMYLGGIPIETRGQTKLWE